MAHSIIIFASGKGTNAGAIMEYFKSSSAKVSLVVSNNPQAGVLEIAKAYQVPTLVVPSREMNTENFIEILHSHNPSIIVLAGYLKKVQPLMVQEFSDRIINLHPALLPQYGGKGMFGAHVHKAVLASADMQSGITIHYVNEKYDEGRIILQATCPVIEGDSVETLATRIHNLEHYYLPRVVAFLLENRVD